MKLFPYVDVRFTCDSSLHWLTSIYNCLQFVQSFALGLRDSRFERDSSNIHTNVLENQMYLDTDLL